MGVLRRILARIQGHAHLGGPEQRPVARRTYLVTRGDDLWKIATREYGDANWWYEIFNANKRLLKAPDLVHPGMTLRLP
jgi:nucleoid-associated protein YgaU